MRYVGLFLRSKAKRRESVGPATGKFNYNHAYVFDLNMKLMLNGQDSYDNTDKRICTL
jgi:hypothetical protein